MSAPNEAHAAEAPLSATRERYRREGYSESEISQILVARATASPAGKSFGSGVATGLLSNLDAILTYARGLLPGFRVDLERMVDGRADKATRLGGALKLAVKLCALGMIGYFLYIESIEFRARAYLAWANACVERQKNAINHTSMTDLLSGKKLDGDDDCVPR